MKFISVFITAALIVLSPGLQSYQAFAAVETRVAEVAETPVELGVLPPMGPSGENLGETQETLGRAVDLQPEQNLSSNPIDAAPEIAQAEIKTDSDVQAKAAAPAPSNAIVGSLAQSVSGFIQSLHKSVSASPDQSIAASRTFWDGGAQTSVAAQASAAAFRLKNFLKAGRFALRPSPVSILRVEAPRNAAKPAVKRIQIAGRIKNFALGFAVALLSAGWAAAQAVEKPQSILEQDEWGFGLAYTKAMATGDPAATADRSFTLGTLRYSTPFSRLNGWGHVPNTDRLRLLVEPNAGWFYQGNHGGLGGLNLMFRGYPWDTGRFLPFIGLGGGSFYTDFNGLASRIDFTLLAAAGFDFKLSDHLTLQAEYRFHHISNGDLVPPNIGIESNYTSVGLSWWIGPKKRATGGLPSIEAIKRVKASGDQTDTDRLDSRIRP